jgi:hypothetical protein
LIALQCREIRLDDVGTTRLIGRAGRIYRYDRAIRGRALFCAVMSVALVAGCGNKDVIVPAVCEEGPATVETALRGAPGEVRLDGGVRISDCLQQAASAADVQNLGSTFLATAQQLADEVRRDPHSDAAVQLGYLIGALRRGAGTRVGVHYEAVRRVQQELAGLDLHTPEFRRGLEAGRHEG